MKFPSSPMSPEGTIRLKIGAAIFALLHFRVIVPLVRSNRTWRVEFPFANFTLERLKIEVAHHVILNRLWI